MIWIWINNFVRWVAWLVIPPEQKIIIPQIDQNAPCPSCGHCNGRLVSESRPDGTLLVRHECSICSARWWEKPVLQETSPTSATTTVLASTPKE